MFVHSLLQAEVDALAFITYSLLQAFEGLSIADMLENLLSIATS